MRRLSINLLGSFALTLDGEEVRGFDSDKGRALLAYLALESERPLRREKLAGLLWPEQTEERARGSLSQAVYNLRKTLQEKDAPQPVLLTTHQSVQFNPQCDCQLDVQVFSDLLEACQRHTHPRLESCAECATRLLEATDLYRGDFLAGFSLAETVEFDEWLLLSRERLRQTALQALARLVIYHESRGEIALALEHAWRLVEMDALWEVGQRSLIRLLALSGQRDAALSQYHSFCRLLEDELGVEPEAETQALYQRLQREAGGQAAIDNLPAALTPFVGRQGELAELGNLLRDPDVRLVTVLGPGGSGKTRLALQVAQGLRYDYPEGVYLAPLSPLITSGGLLAVVAEALGVKFREGSDSQKQLKDYLYPKRVLLILDGFETVLAGAGWLSDLLRTAPLVKALVTSRVRLNLKGEQVFTLGGMGYPEPGAAADTRDDMLQYGAVQLFVAGVQRRGGDLAWGEEDWCQVGRICRLVDGMPLGVLLAAAWVDTYTPAEIAAEIGTGLDILSADWQDAPERQRSLRATLDYSWRLLSAQEQVLYCKLSVFQGGFSRQAARDVYGVSPLVLQALVDKSMLEVRSAGRYGMHDLLRQYAREKLAGDPQVEHQARGAHAAYYLGALPDWEAGLKSARQGKVLQMIDAEIGNLSVAWVWAVDNQNVELLGRGLNGICLYATLRARTSEGQVACQYLLDKLNEISNQPGVLQVMMLANGWNARFLCLSGRPEASAHLLIDSLEALRAVELSDLDTRAEQAFLLLNLGSATLASDRQAARDNFQHSLKLFQAKEDLWGQAQALAGLGLVAHHSGTFADAVGLFQHSLELYEQLGDPKAIASVLIEMGHNLLRQGLFEQGEACARRGVEIYNCIGDQASLADSLLQLSRICFWSGNFPDGISLMEKARPVFQDLGLLENYTFTLVGEAIPLVLLGNFEAAQQRAQQGREVAEEYGFERFRAVALWVLGMSALVQGNYWLAHQFLLDGVDIYRSIGQTDELGWALASLAYAELGLDHTVEFLRYLCEALKLGIEIRGLFTILIALPAACLYLLGDEKADGSSVSNVERSLELYALAWRYPSVAKAPWFEIVAGREICTAASRLPPEVVEAARARGQVGDLFEMAQLLVEDFSVIRAGLE